MKEIKLTQGKVALVDDDMFEELNKFKWCANLKQGKYWYAIRGSGKEKRETQMHRVIMNASSGVEVTHKDGNGLNNQKDNLGLLTSSERCKLSGYKRRNKPALWSRKPESTVPRTGRWRATLLYQPNGKTCELSNIGGCSQKKMEIHHVDKNPMNNTPENIMILCTSHHRLIEDGKIDINNPLMPPFIISSGKRRYKF